jgi:acyl-coenzyme A thioesterase PaaI-like protein
MTSHARYAPPLELSYYPARNCTDTQIQTRLSPLQDDASALFRYPPKWVRDQKPADGYRLALRALAEEFRELLELVTDTTASETQLQELTAQARALRAAISATPRGRTRAGYGKMAESNSERAYLDTSPVIGLANPMAPPLQLWVEGHSVRGRAIFNHAYEGPPGHVHGGFIAAAFDDVLGATQSATGHPGMTAKLAVTYRGPVPLNQEVLFEGHLERVAGKKIFASASLHVDGALRATAEGLFISVDFVAMHNRVISGAAEKPLSRSAGEGLR